MSAQGMDSPYTIADLPRPIDKQHGQVRASTVSALRGSKKRKRHEVAVGIDGEGVSIYNVQSQNFIASYPVAPQTYFSCQPCSVYCRPTSTSPARRRTYAITRDGRKSARRNITCFTENVRGKAAEEDSAAPNKKELGLDNGDIVGLDVAPGSEGQDSVLITYKSGLVLSADLNLSAVQRHSLPRPGDSGEGEVEVEYAAVVDSESARKGLLRGREDVIVLLDLSTSKDPRLFCRIVRSQDTRRLELFSIRTPSIDVVQTTQPSVQFLLGYDLPARAQGSGNAQFELHAASGILYQLRKERLIVCDVSGTIPKVTAQIGSSAMPITSFARISVSGLLAVSSESATFYETKYGSVQGSVSLADVADTSKADALQNKKRKRGDNASHPLRFRALSAFTDIGIVAGLSEGHPSQLLALQLQDIFQSSKRSKSQATLLADVLGNGDFKKLHENEKAAHGWGEWKTKVDELAQAQDAHGLEQLVASDEKLGKQWQDDSFDEDADADDWIWPTPRTFNPQDMDRRKAQYLMSKVFKISPEREQLGIALPASRLLEWLALAGLLTSSHIQESLYPAGSKSAGSGRTIQEGEIMVAIGEMDPDFDLIHSLLSLPVHWNVADVVQVLRVVIQSFDSNLEAEPQLTLPAPPQTNGNVSSPDDSESNVDLESKAAEHELAHAHTALLTGLETRSQTLQMALARLHTFSPPAVTTAMRTLMVHKEMIFFIHLLRVELAEGGWTSKYIDAAPDSAESDEEVNPMAGAEESGPSDQAIRAIGDLLNCAIDAVGISGWLVGLSGKSSGIEDLIDSLRAEISAGLESCYEADTLTTFLRELEQGKVNLRDVAEDEDLTLLPLSGKSKDKGKFGKAGKGRLAAAKERLAGVGEYSFETIRI